MISSSLSVIHFSLNFGRIKNNNFSYTKKLNWEQWNTGSLHKNAKEARMTLWILFIYKSEKSLPLRSLLLALFLHHHHHHNSSRALKLRRYTILKKKRETQRRAKTRSSELNGNLAKNNRDYRRRRIKWWVALLSRKMSKFKTEILFTIDDKLAFLPYIILLLP